MNARPYCRVYHEIVDDPKFARVYDNDKALATWLRMLLVADAMYPVSAPMPPRTPTVQLLIEVSLVEERPGNRYAIKGLAAERERRSAIGRNAAAVRYHSERTANAMPRRDETSKDETSNGANAPKNAGNFMGFRPKASSADVRRQDAEAWTPCATCGVIGRKHPASGEHPFTPKVPA